jgi:nitroimidazol reductase NimA-like FMN-containing flavoprotein (pyridoxamine 5'-phosphate oxidase superfamily)
LWRARKREERMSEFEVTPRSQARRLAKRARYDRETVYAIVDEALVCHVGFVEEGQPVVIPTLHAREGDCLLLHGAVESRLIRHVQAGHPLCVSLALVDGLVLGKAACSHSMNYRSAVLFGQGRLVEGEAAKLRALELLTERLMPGRWQEVRPPSARELEATAIVSIAVQEASAKVRTGPPADSRRDRELPIWAGVVPLRQIAQPPIGAEYADKDIPDYLAVYLHRQQDAQIE